MKRHSLLLLCVLLVVSVIFGGVVRAENPTLDENDLIIAWTAPATVPYTHTPDQPGEIVFVDSTGETVPLVPVPQQSSRIESCGAGLSPDGRHYAFFLGLETNNGGGLYLMTDGGTPVELEATLQSEGGRVTNPGGMQYLGCLGGNGRLSFSPDSSRLAYIDYEADGRQTEFADGILNVLSTSDLSVVFSARNAVSFDITDEGVAYSSFFTNSFDEADEAAITYWDGSADREVATFIAGEECKFTSSYVTFGPDGTLWASLRENCRNESEWQLYSINVAERNALLALTQEPQGAHVSFAETNNIFFSPDGQVMYYTMPDGVTSSSAQLFAVRLSDMTEPITLIERDALMPTYNSVRDGLRNAFPVTSPDGRWYAVVVGTPSNDNQLYVFDLSNVDAPPIVISAGSRSDTIPFMQFTPDSSRLIYIAGGAQGADNSLFYLDVESGEPTRVRRGAYSGFAALSPEGDEVAVLEYQVQPEGVRGPDYLNLVVINVESSEVTTLIQGGEVIDGEVQNTFFVSPVLWIRR